MAHAAGLRVAARDRARHAGRARRPPGSDGRDVADQDLARAGSRPPHALDARRVVQSRPRGPRRAPASAYHPAHRWRDRRQSRPVASQYSLACAGDVVAGLGRRQRHHPGEGTMERPFSDTQPWMPSTPPAPPAPPAAPPMGTPAAPKPAVAPKPKPPAAVAPKPAVAAQPKPMAAAKPKAKAKAKAKPKAMAKKAMSRGKAKPKAKARPKRRR